MATEPSAGQEQRELERLRARVDELERELAERTAKAEAAVAAAEDRSYWLDRLRIDLNTVMRNPVARAAFQVVFFVVKALRAAKQRLG
jgi:cell division septum initiation protein DivIVA